MSENKSIVKSLWENVSITRQPMATVQDKQRLYNQNQKSFSTYDIPFSFAGYLQQNGQSQLLASETIRMYKECSPFFNAVNKRAEAFSSIPPRVYDTASEEFIDDHPVLDLLKKPNPIGSQTAFMKAYSSFFDITGDSFLIATGDKGDEPLELFVARPQDFSTESSSQIGSIGYPRKYTMTTSGGTCSFYLDDDELGGSFRYWNLQKEQELWHIMDFNPMQSNVNFRGLSKAAPLWLQIQQFIDADTNNWSILKRGGRPSLAWVWKHNEPMTDDQYQRWAEQVNAYEGAINAGRQLLLDNMELQDFGVSNRDMQFKENRQSVKEDIYTIYGIPLALISSESMTMDNLKISMQLFFDDAVLPLADNLFDELTRFLMPRYPDSENLVITYNTNDIVPIRERLLDQTIKEAGLNVQTDNEIRASIGYEGVDGGDVIWKPSNLLPAESDRFTDDNLDEPDITAPNDKARRKARERFIAELKVLRDSEGKRMWTDAQIKNIADKQGF